MFRRYWPPTSKNGVRQLAKRADPGGLHQLVEHVALAGGHILQPAQRVLGLAGVPAWNSASRLSWLCFSCSVARASSISTGGSSDSGLMNVFTPMIGNEPSCLRCS